MTAVTIAPRAPFGLRATRSAAGLERILAWAAAFALTVYLAMSGGGYDIVVRGEIGLVLWWFVLLGLLVGLLPRVRLEPLAWLVLGLLIAFLAWTWIGASWAPSQEQALNSVALVSGYVAVLAIGVLALSAGSGAAVLGGLAAGIAVVCAIALLSKLIPSLFPYSSATKVYDTARLSYPFDYSDGVGEFAAVGLPLLLYVASGARSLLARALAQAGLPVVLLCLAMTVSRGGIFAACVGVVAFYVLAPDRIPRLVAGALAAAGIAVLMLALLHREALRNSLSVAPASERHSMLTILIVVVALSAVAQLAYGLIAARIRRPRWLTVSRRGAQRISAAVAAAVLALVIVAFAGGTVSNLWHDFKQANPTTHSNQYFRLLSLAGSHRYQYWQVALHAFDGSPFHGIGPGGFRYYWAEHQTIGEYVVNAHSLWVETLAELGVVGALLLVAFFLSAIVAGVRRALRAAAAARLQSATAAAALLGFCAAAAFDWVWQIGVMPMIAMLLAAVIVTAGRGAEPAALRESPPAAETPMAAGPAGSAIPAAPTAPKPVAIPIGALAIAGAEQAAAAATAAQAATAGQAAAATPPAPAPATQAASSEPLPPSPPPPPAPPRRAAPWRDWLLRAVLAVGVLAACWGIAVPLSSTIAVRKSQTAARHGDIALAFKDAATAQSIEPGAASPRLQTALLLEQEGAITQARRALATALKRDPLDSTTWLIASRMATEAGDAKQALADFKRGRSLNPTSPIFAT